jgi:hypothetical protein
MTCASETGVRESCHLRRGSSCVFSDSNSHKSQSETLETSKGRENAAKTPRNKKVPCPHYTRDASTWAAGAGARAPPPHRARARDRASSDEAYGAAQCFPVSRVAEPRGCTAAPPSGVERTLRRGVGSRRAASSRIEKFLDMRETSKQSEIAERKTGDGWGPGDHSIEAV